MDFIETLEKQFNIRLNNQQRKAVAHKNGPALVLAGPGSGKTTVITARTAYLCREASIPPYKILSMTYSRASAKDMKERFEQLYGDIVKQPVRFSTIHSFCNSVVKDYEKRQGNTFKRMDASGADSQQAVVKMLYSHMYHSKIEEEDLEKLIQAIGLVKNRMLSDPEKLSCDVPNFPAVYRAYEDYKCKKLLMDFDDMLTYAYIIMCKCPDILQKYRRRYSYIQLDEGQDASKIQFAIIDKLAGSNNPNLFVVADDDQSIYGFRGAEPREILNMRKRYPDCRVFRLEKNYRSTRNIVKISSRFIRNNADRYDKQHTTDNKSYRDPVILRCKDEYSQLLYILGKIQESAEKAHDGTMAVLYRNNLTSISLVDFLDRNGIPFKLRETKMFFFRHWVVQDISAILKFSLNQKDAESLSLFYYKINRYLSKAMLEYAVNLVPEESLIDTMTKYPGLKEFRQKKLRDLKIEFTTISKMSAESAIRFIENGFNYTDYIKEYCKKSHSSSDYACGIFEILIDIAHGCDTVPDFLERLETLEQIYAGGRTSAETNLTLSTLHSSKGLEFDTVFMIDLTSDEIPGKAVTEKPDENKTVLEEERRLFYVGMTRARKNLYLMFPDKKGGSKQRQSIFIDEVAACMGIRKEKPQKQEKYSKKDIPAAEGLVIHHKQFGEGVITSVDYQGKYILVDIKFKDQKRVLDWNVCLSNNLIYT